MGVLGLLMEGDRRPRKGVDGEWAGCPTVRPSQTVATPTWEPDLRNKNLRNKNNLKDGPQTLDKRQVQSQRSRHCPLDMEDGSIQTVLQVLNLLFYIFHFEILVIPGHVYVLK